MQVLLFTLFCIFDFGKSTGSALEIYRNLITHHFTSHPGVLAQDWLYFRQCKRLCKNYSKGNLTDLIFHYRTLMECTSVHNVFHPKPYYT